jgi:DNA mismatch repair ATPase MutS
MVFSQRLSSIYRELKKDAPGFILLMQVGAFMQMMDDEAHAVSQVTGLKLQMAGEVDTPVVLLTLRHT